MLIYPEAIFAMLCLISMATVSLIREGWQGVMIPMMVEILLETPRHEFAEEFPGSLRERRVGGTSPPQGGEGAKVRRRDIFQPR